MPKPRNDRPRKVPTTEEKKTMPDQVGFLKTPPVTGAVNTIYGQFGHLSRLWVWSQVWLLN